jgi:hypothetical protein
MNNKSSIGLCIAIVAVCLGTLFVSACATDTDTIENRRNGQIMVCHKGRKTLTVSNADSFVHLDHGDAAGPCPDEGSD